MMPNEFSAISVLLLSAATAALVSLLVNWLVLRWWQSSQQRFATKPEKQTQDFHEHNAPRTGGIGLMAGLAAGLMVADWSLYFFLFLLCLLPAFAAGILEDFVRKEVSPWLRLGFTMISGVMAIIFLDAEFNKTGIYLLDVLVTNSPVFSLICILLITAGAAHSTNVIDGFNGLMPGYGIIACIAFMWLSMLVEDPLSFSIFTVLLGTLVGLFAINFPRGSVFSGDSGAYLLGAALGIASIVLLQRNPQVSPWFPMVIMSYPVGETIFSIIRKRVILGKPAMQPDKYHLHMVIHRLIKKRVSPKNANAMTAPFLWPLTIVPAIGAGLYPFNTKVLIIICLGYGSIYICLYVILVMREIMQKQS